MAIKIRCEQCGKGYKVPNTKSGKQLKCRECSALIQIPGPIVDDSEEYEDISHLVPSEKVDSRADQTRLSEESDENKNWFLIGIGGGVLAILLLIGLSLYLFLPSKQEPEQVAKIKQLQPEKTETKPVKEKEMEPVAPVVKSTPREQSAPVAKAAPSKTPVPVPAVVKPKPEKNVPPIPIESDRYAAVRDSLQKIANAFHNYHGTHQGFLPDPKIYKHYYDKQGRLKVSWRVHLLPFIGENVLYLRFKLDDPWDSPINQEAAKYMPKIYRSPETPADSNLTRFRGFEEMVSPEKVKEPAPPVAPLRGRRRRSRQSSVASLFTVGSRGKIRSITDGLDNTIMLVETGPDQAVEWTKPGELDMAAPVKQIGSNPVGTPALFCGGRVLLLKPDVNDQLWRNMIHQADQAQVKLDEISVKQHRKLPSRSLKYPQLQKISAGFNRFHNANRCFPPKDVYKTNGKQLLSWRVHLLPYLGAKTLYEQFKLDEAWNSPHNLKLLKFMPDVYECEGVKRVGQTTIMIFTGEGTPFTGKRNANIRSIRDGLRYTILFVQAGPSKAVPWTKPEDLTLDPNDPFKPLGKILGDHFPVGLMDGEIREIKTDLSAEKLKNLINPEDNQLIGNF